MKTNFPHKLLLTNRQVANLRKAFANYLSTDIKLSKNEISKIIQSGGFLGRLLYPLVKTGLPLMKNVIKPLAKGVLIPLRLTAAASLISNDEMKYIIETVKPLEDSILLLKGVSKTIQNEAKEQKEGFLSMLLGALGASSLGNILAGKGIKRAGEGVIRAGYGNKT